jgi:hypothetical protein
VTRRIEVEIGRLVVEDPALAHIDLAAALERELGRLAHDGRGQTETHDREAPTPVSAVAREIRARLAR